MGTFVALPESSSTRQTAPVIELAAYISRSLVPSASAEKPKSLWPSEPISRSNTSVSKRAGLMRHRRGVMLLDTTRAP
jgi:hypothetical protein